MLFPLLSLCIHLCHFYVGWRHFVFYIFHYEYFTTFFQYPSPLYS